MTEASDLFSECEQPITMNMQKAINVNSLIRAKLETRFICAKLHVLTLNWILMLRSILLGVFVMVCRSLFFSVGL
jgi:hypothetical protein